VSLAAADVSTTFPVNGKFSPQQAIVYNAVYAANQAVMNAAKPGADYVSRISCLEFYKFVD